MHARNGPHHCPGSANTICTMCMHSTERSWPKLSCQTWIHNLLPRLPTSHSICFLVDNRLLSCKLVQWSHICRYATRPECKGFGRGESLLQETTSLMSCAKYAYNVSFWQQCAQIAHRHFATAARQARIRWPSVLLRPASARGDVQTSARKTDRRRLQQGVWLPPPPLHSHTSVPTGALVSLASISSRRRASRCNCS